MVLKKYKYGVMSKVWTLESENDVVAYITMSVSIGQNVPVAVYEPKKDSFMPGDILDKHKDGFDSDAVAECMLTRKELA